ncbi:MAG: alpha/beta fold hydrolase, partial [Bacteroidota bacterium]
QVEAYLEPLLLPGTARAILHMQRFSREIAVLDAAALDVPALAIWGENDTWVPLESGNKVLEKMPGVQLRVIEQAGHNPMETHPDQFMTLWMHFLDNL